MMLGLLDVKTTRVSLERPLHTVGEVGLGSLNDHVKMVGHEAISMNHEPATRFFTSLSKRFDKTELVFIVQEDGLAPISPVHYMVNRSGILNP
jgi:hypothetical protein